MQTGALYLEELESAFIRKVRFMRYTKRRSLGPLLQNIDGHFKGFRADLDRTPVSMKMRPEELGHLIPPQSTYYQSFLALHLCLLPYSAVESQLNYCQNKFIGNYYTRENRGFIAFLDESVRTMLGLYSGLAHKRTLRAINEWIRKIFQNDTTVAGRMIEFTFEGTEKEQIIAALSKITYEQNLANIENLFNPGYVLPIYFTCPTNAIVDLFYRICFYNRTRTSVTQKRLCEWLCEKVGMIEKGEPVRLRSETVLSVIKKRERAPKQAILPDLFAVNRKAKRKKGRSK